MKWRCFAKYKTPILLECPKDLVGKGAGSGIRLSGKWAGPGNTIPASTQQRIDDGFDMNHGCVEKLAACVAGVAQ